MHDHRDDSAPAMGKQKLDGKYGCWKGHDMQSSRIAEQVITLPAERHRATKLATRFASAVAFTVGVVHLMLSEQHLHKALWVGAAFVAGGVALLYTAWELGQRSNPWAWLVGAFTLAAMFGFGLASRTVGLPGFPIAKWSPPLITSLALETLYLALFAVVAQHRDSSAELERNVDTSAVNGAGVAAMKSQLRSENASGGSV
jgi:hypothetical protein